MFAQLAADISDQAIELQKYHPSLGTVQILSDTSDTFLNGGPSIGKKREALVQRADGKYLCFLDDDETIAPNYLETIVRLCHKNADVVTFRNFTTTDFYWTVVDMSLENEINEEANPDRIVRRRPWHICPVKSEYAKLYSFPDTNYGEDWTWFEKVLKHCENESHTDAILHAYNHSTQDSESDKIIKAGYV